MEPALSIVAEIVPDVPAALQTATAWLRDEQDIDPIAIGHRVVHGGPDHDRPVLIDAEVLARLERYTSLAPLHQPHNLAPIRAALARFPHLPQVACFDTAFRRGRTAVVDHYALPRVTRWRCCRPTAPSVDLSKDRRHDLYWQ